MNDTVASKIAGTVEAIQNCKRTGNAEWEMNHGDTLDAIEREILPSGAGFDAGCKIDREESTGKRIVIRFNYHHMDDNGSYTGWESYQAIVTPTFGGVDVNVYPAEGVFGGGDFLDYAAETLEFILGADWEHNAERIAA